VNRLSVGAQSFNAAELHTLGRRHSPSDIADTVVAARSTGIDNISLDLLYDVPGQTLESWRASLGSAVTLDVQHISAYALTLENPTGPDHLPVSNGARRWRHRAQSLQNEDRAADMYALADDLLASTGYGWYEISNWARSGRESRHNLVYWNGEPWEAVGPGAHAFDGHRTRRWNAARLDLYLAALNARQLPPGSSDTADPASAQAEAAILRLRTATGLPASVSTHPALASALDWGRAHHLVEPAPAGGTRLTLSGRLLSNELFARLLPTRESAAA
jgi:oxygen-independent coproporphyrinogen-3 oxidase